MNCSPPGSSVHGISQARIREWVPFPPPRDLPDPGMDPCLAEFPSMQADSLPLNHQEAHTITFYPGLKTTGSYSWLAALGGLQGLRNSLRKLASSLSARSGVIRSSHTWSMMNHPLLPFPHPLLLLSTTEYMRIGSLKSLWVTTTFDIIYTPK